MGLPDEDPLFEFKGRRPTTRVLRFTLLGFLFLVFTVLQYHSSLYAWVETRQRIDTNFCAQPSPAAERSNYSSAYDSPEFKEKSARRLSGAVKVPTMSFDDMGPPLEDERWAPFTKMHQYLEDTFPVVHQNLERVIVGGYSLVYTLQGSRPELKPLLLTGHFDVVPALTALDRWTFPPFEGKIDGEWVYGRGAADCKNNVIGILSALEHLLQEGWTPERTIVLAFGQDEEISGPRGAASIANLLENKYGHYGIAMIVDEGGMGLNTIYGKEFALPGIAEKGYVNAVITVEMSGGHSSIPTRHTSIGILSKIISVIEDAEAFRPNINDESPIWGYLTCIAEHGEEEQVPAWIQEAVSNPSPDFDSVAENFAATSLDNRYLIQTSKAATIINGGVKVNALAETATVNFNSRIEIFSSLSEVAQTYVQLVKPVAAKYSLLLEGRAYSEEPSIGNITFTWDDPHDPSPISPANLGNAAWSVFSKAVQASFGQNVITAPSSMTGNTGHVIFIDGALHASEQAGSRLLMTSEIDTHVDAIRFYTELILIADQALELV